MESEKSAELQKFDLKIAQPSDGYRFSLDALLLADFADCSANKHIVDLGTGCGIIPMILCNRYTEMSLVGIESNYDMAVIARENVTNNGMEDRIKIIHEDILATRSLYPVSSFDGVVANPPYRVPGTGKISPKAGRDHARHESTAGLVDFLAAAKYLVKPSGHIWFVYHPDRLVEFINCANTLKLSVIKLRMVHGNQKAHARIFLAELVKGRKGTITIMPPLVIHGTDGAYTQEAERILAKQ